MPTVRRLAAIVAADMVGYSRLMSTDEEGTHERLRAHRRELVEPKISEHSGRIVKTTGDGMLMEFASVVDAVRCAAELQRAMIDREAGVPEDRRIRFRIGINLGDVIAEDNDIFGDGVNVAARLEALSEPGGLCISRTVHDHIRDKLPYPFEDMGEQSIKNIARPVRIFAFSAAAVAVLPPVAATEPPKATAALVRPRPDVPWLSIVVLPFANLSNDPEQEYFADGITDDLTTDLSRISGSFVIARTTAFTYKGKSVDVRQRAQQAFERALEVDDRSVGAKIGLAATLVTFLGNAWSSSVREDQARAEELLREALEHDPNVSMAHYAMGYLRRLQSRLGESRSEYEKAISLDPNNAVALAQLGTTLRFCGDPEAAIPYVEKAIWLNPRDPNIGHRYRDLGVCHLLLGHLDEAVALLREARASNPRFWLTYLELAGALGLTGDIGEAGAALREWIKLRPEMNSLARYRTNVPFGNPQYWALREKTVNIGLRRAGFPEE